MPETPRAAIVGLGVMGRDHLKNAVALQQQQALMVVSLVDVDVVRARQAAEPYGIPAYQQLEEMLEQTRPDFIVVATPHPLHEEATVAAARRGVHVLCEKPIANSVDAADRMVDACRSAGVLLGMDFNQRTTPSYVRAHDIIAAGELGELYRVSFVASGWYRTQAYYESGGWRGTWAGEGGGVIMNQAPHHLDLYCWLAGLPSRVKASVATRIHAIEVENTVAALLEHGAERIDSFYTTTAEWPGRTEFLFAGQKGRLVVAEQQLRLYRLRRTLGEEILTAPHGSRPKGAWEDVDIPPAAPDQNGHVAVLRRFAQAVRSGDPAEMVATGEDGRRALELANAMLLASHRDRTVPLPIDRDDYRSLLTELRQKAASAVPRAGQRGNSGDQRLATLPEAT